MSELTNAELRAAVYQDLTRAHPAQRANVMALVSAQRIVALLDENERLRDALKAITSEEGAYMACSDLPWCHASANGPGSLHAEDCAVGIALAALASVKETK